MTCPSKSAYELRRGHYLEPWKEAGKRLQAIRKEAGLTQEEVAKRAKMSLAYYRHLEQGYNNPLSCPLDAKKALSKAFRRPIEELFGDGI